MGITQWRYAGMGGARTGLDYSAMIAMVNLYGHGPEVFEQIRWLELGALLKFNGKDLGAIDGENV